MIAMDEPTASLSGPESEQLFSIIRDLSAQGVAILYVSHRLEEVLELCDRITVLRDGRIVAEEERGALDKKGLVRAIIGHDVASVHDTDRFAADRAQPPVFPARNVSWKTRVRNVSFDLYRGEVLALGGLFGAGRTELVHLAAGVTRPDSGHFELGGEVLRVTREAQAIDAGIALVPEERRSQGLMLQQTVGFNINVATLRQIRAVPGLPFVSTQKARRQADRLIGELGIKTLSALVKIAGLSGGNQQKALIARWLPAGMRLLILDGPLRGVDVGAREEIHAAIRELARPGVGMLVISSDAEELALLVDRVLVMGEFDLSIGFVASFVGLIVTGLMAHEGLPIWLSIIVALMVGSGIGGINGILVTKIRINAVITSLGIGTMLTGLGFTYSQFPIASCIPFEFTDIALSRPVLDLPSPVLIMALVLVVLWIILNKTDFGQRMQAVGANIEAARLSGIRVDLVKILAFCTAGFCADLTGILLSALLGSGTLGTADGYLLDAFAAVFLGSATLEEGEFHIVGTLIGVLILAVGFNGLSIFGAPTHFQPIFKGGILILAVGMSALARRYAANL